MRPLSDTLTLALYLTLIVTLSASVGALAQATGTDQPSSTATSLGAANVHDVYHDVSPVPIREIVPQPPPPDLPYRAFDLESGANSSLASNGSLMLTPQASDCALQSTASTTLNTVDFVNVPGQQGGFPPDPNAAVGSSQVMQWLNNFYEVFSYSGTSLYGPAAMSSTIFNGFPGDCSNEANDAGDGYMQYDKLANRWVVTQPVTHYLCLAVSQTDDATGLWYRYAFDVQTFPDMPFLSVWPDGYYVTTGSDYSRLWVFERAKILIDASAGSHAFTDMPTRPLVADLDGLLPPPAGSPAYAFQVPPNSTPAPPASGTNTIQMWTVSVDWATPAFNLSGPNNISVCDWTAPTDGCKVSQQGTGQQLTPFVNYRVAYRNFRHDPPEPGDYETVTFAHPVGEAPPTCVAFRWYELRFTCGAPPCTGVPSLYQEGTYAPDAQSRWAADMAMDGLGDIAIGYSKSGPGMYPEIWYAGRAVTDTSPLGTLSSEKCIVGGSCPHAGASQTDTDRWGDYMSMRVDPIDDCELWYTNEYFPSIAQPRSTRLAEFFFPQCEATFVGEVYPVGTTYVENINPSTNYSAAGFLLAGRTASSAKGGLPQLDHTLLYFDLTGAIPSGKTVRSAILYLDEYDGQNTPTFSIQRLTNPFSPWTATWSNTGLGGTTSAPPAGVAIPLTASPTNRYIPLNVTTLAMDCQQNRSGQCYWRISEVNETDNTTSYLKTGASPFLEIGYR